MELWRTVTAPIWRVVRWVIGLYSVGTLVVWVTAKARRQHFDSKWLVYGLAAALLLAVSQYVEIHRLRRPLARPRRAKVEKVMRYIRERSEEGEALLRQLDGPLNPQQAHDTFVAVERWEFDTRTRLATYGPHWFAPFGTDGPPGSPLPSEATSTVPALAEFVAAKVNRLRSLLSEDAIATGESERRASLQEDHDSRVSSLQVELRAATFHTEMLRCQQIAAAQRPTEDVSHLSDDERERFRLGGRTSRHGELRQRIIAALREADRLDLVAAVDSIDTPVWPEDFVAAYDSLIVMLERWSYELPGTPTTTGELTVRKADGITR